MLNAVGPLETPTRPTRRFLGVLFLAVLSLQLLLYRHSFGVKPSNDDFVALHQVDRGDAEGPSSFFIASDFDDYEDVDLAWRARLAGWQARYAPRAVVYHKFSASHRRGSPLKTYLCERNRIWNLVQNYPWRYAALTVPWNSARNLAGSIPWTDGKEPAAAPHQKSVVGTARAMARARVDAYAGIPRALEKRRARVASLRVGPATVGEWLRKYHVSFRDAVLA